MNGIGPLTVSSPSPMLDSHQQNGQFPTPIEIRQFQQNQGLWGTDNGSVGPMDGAAGVMLSQLDTPFQHPNALCPGGILVITY